MKESEVDVGNLFGKLTIESKPFRKFFPEKKHNKSRLYVKAACECGTKKEIPCADLVRGNINSCGCLRVKRLQKGTYAENGIKKCCRCLRDLSVAMFNNNKACKDELNCHCIDCERKKRRLGLYGISQYDYDKLLSDQDRKCACCGMNQNDWFRPFDVDHCHKTGAVRGLLCGKCNTNLGRLGDDLESVKKSVEQLILYLGKTDMFQ